MKTRSYPARECRKMIAWAHRQSPFKPSDNIDCELAHRLRGIAADFLPVWERVRSPKLRGAWGGVATALKWIVAHPGQMPTPETVWPDVRWIRMAA